VRCVTGSVFRRLRLHGAEARCDAWMAMSEAGFGSQKTPVAAGAAATWGSYRCPILPLILERGWDSLYFQPRAAQILESDLVRWHKSASDDSYILPNAYLFSGPSGCGQEEGFVLLAATVLCLEPRSGAGTEVPAPCWSCKSCRMMLDGTHPDAQFLEPEGNTYLVDFIRERVVQESKYSGTGGGQRFVLIRESERLSRAASNALLRTIEEPLGRVTFVLAASPDRDAILPTLASRCREVAFLPIPPARLEELLRNSGYDPERAHAAILGGDGTLEGTAQAAETGSYADFSRQAAELIWPVFCDASANPMEVAGMLRESIDSVVEEVKASLDSEIRQAEQADEELGLGSESGRAQALRNSKHRRLRRVETAICRQVVTVCETLALACGLVSADLKEKASQRLAQLGPVVAQDAEALRSSPVSGSNSSDCLDRLTALTRQARNSLALNPRVDLWLDGLVVELYEIVSPV
jgi:hypothetical protein